MKSIWRGQLLETMTMQTHALKPLFPVALALLITGCAVGPSYQRPITPEVIAYKEAGDWVTAQPADALERGPIPSMRSSRFSYFWFSPLTGGLRGDRA